MKIKFVLCITLTLSLIINLSSCKGNKSQFIVKGKIEGAADSVLYLYKRGITGADLIDSAKIGQDASFQIKSASPRYPELYVLSLGKQMINLAVDSIETIEITAKKTNFSTNYTVKGSQQSQLIYKLYLKQMELSQNLNQLKTQLDSKKIADATYTNKAQQTIITYKQFAQDIILKNLKELSAYYALFQQVDNKIIFDPLSKEDSRYFAAVATAWDTYRKGSPRAEHLKGYTLTSIAQRRAMEGKGPTVMDKAKPLNSTEYYNISLLGIDERKTELKSFRGKVVLLDFTMYQDKNAPAHNVALNKIYQKFKNSEFVIYQVSFNTPIQFWKTAASNLPWVCVREDDPNSNLATRFNLQSLPTTYLINKDGEVSKRIEAKDNISEEIQKML